MSARGNPQAIDQSLMDEFLPFRHVPLGQPAGPDPLIAQIALLREDIQALRRDLAPMSSTILTGRDVVAEFQRLKAPQ